MRSAVRILLSMCLFTVPAWAATIFFDDFQQFPNGTPLTQTNYVPNVGELAEITTNENGEASTTVVSSNFLGSTRAFFQLGTPPYDHSYRGDQTGGALTNVLLTLGFKLWIEQTKNATHIGGIGINVTTTNIDFIGGTETNLNNNPLIFLNDGGQVYAFTNEPSQTSINPIQIGSWASQAGKFMTNVLVLDFPGGMYSYSMNGTVLTNLPIPAYVTNLFERVRLDVFEGIANSGTLNSLGNRFALDDVRLSSGAASTNRDVEVFIAAAKGMSFDQLTAGTPTMISTGFQFHADITGVESNSIIAASVQPPAGPSQALTRDQPDDRALEFNDAFTTMSALDNAYPSSATYSMIIDAQNQGVLTPAMNLPADDYPNTPQISNFAAAQSIYSSTNFTLRWSALTGGTTTDFISVDIEDQMGNAPFGTPDFGHPGALNGTATSVDIPGGTLQSGTAYKGRVLFVKSKNVDTNSVPGATGVTAYFKLTEFPMATVSIGPACSLSPALATNDVLDLHEVTATVTTDGVAAAGIVVDFSVISGPGSANSGTDITDDNGQAFFDYTSGTTGLDVIQAVGMVSSMSFTCTATKVWLEPNVLPVALCQDVTNAANNSCQADVTADQVDDGSFDIDGVIVNRVLIPPGPYVLGDTAVNLTITDDRGGMDSCQATITVVDQTPPMITCPANVTTNVPFGQTDAVVTYAAPAASDNCSLASTNCTPPSGSTFPLGTNVVTCTAVDGAGLTNTCTFNVVVSEAPPQADLALVKVATPVPVLLGNDLTYTIIVTNQGPNDADSVTVTDPLPSGVTFVSAIASQGSVTQITGTVTGNLGALASGTRATVTIVVTPGAAGQVCNSATVTGATTDPVATNNSGTDCVDVEVHDMAVISLKAPKKITLSETKPSQTKKVKISIQNRSAHTETIANMGVLTNLVTLTIESLGACPNPVTVLEPPKSFPVMLASKKKLNLTFNVTIDCANDPAANSSSSTGHEDYNYIATVHHEAIDGKPDTHLIDDACPHGPLPGGVDPNPDGSIKDKGCGGKNPDGTLGAPVVTDVTIK